MDDTLNLTIRMLIQRASDLAEDASTLTGYPIFCFETNYGHHSKKMRFAPLREAALL